MGLFGKKNTNKSSVPTAKQDHARERQQHGWSFEIMFGWLFILAVLELGFSLDTFQYKQRTGNWRSTTERQRIGLLLFSSFRSVILAAVYLGFHRANKWFGSLHHTIYLVLNTVFWCITGALIHDLLGYVECGGVGPVKGGLNECHELKIIEILSWIIAVSSIIITVPIVMGAMKRRKEKMDRGETLPQRKGWFQKLGFKSGNKTRGSRASNPPLMNEKHVGNQVV